MPTDQPVCVEKDQEKPYGEEEKEGRRLLKPSLFPVRGDSRRLPPEREPQPIHQPRMH
jgi:hypothetical protein